MIDKIKKFFRQLRCSHIAPDLVRWHWTHGPNSNDPCAVEVEYLCGRCGKFVYIYLDGVESLKWAKVMGDYKYD
jgi:hypothetical protein